MFVRRKEFEQMKSDIALLKLKVDKLVPIDEDEIDSKKEIRVKKAKRRSAPRFSYFDRSKNQSEMLNGKHFLELIRHDFKMTQVAFARELNIPMSVYNKIVHYYIGNTMYNSEKIINFMKSLQKQGYDFTNIKTSRSFEKFIKDYCFESGVKIQDVFN